jgi:WD40 repeat protein
MRMLGSVLFFFLVACDRKADPPKREAPKPEAPKSSELDPIRRDPLSFLRTITGHKEDITSVAFHPDGKHLLTGGSVDGIRVWEVETGKETGWWPIDGKVTGIAICPSQSGVLVGSDRAGVTLRSLDKGELITGWRDARVDQFLIWRSDGLFLAGQSLWRRNDHRPVATIPEWFRGAAFAGLSLLTGGDFFQVKLWDEELKKAEILGQHLDPVEAIVVRRDGSRAYTASNGSIKMWGLETRVEMANWIGPSHGVKAMAISPDGKRLAVGGLWLSLLDAETGREIFRQKEEPVSAIEFSPDGKFVVTRSGRTVKLWSVNE